MANSSGVDAVHTRGLQIDEVRLPIRSDREPGQRADRHSSVQLSDRGSVQLERVDPARRIVGDEAIATGVSSPSTTARST
jgi:hypothetical protein